MIAVSSQSCLIMWVKLPGTSVQLVMVRIPFTVQMPVAVIVLVLSDLARVRLLNVSGPMFTVALVPSKITVEPVEVNVPEFDQLPDTVIVLFVAFKVPLLITKSR